MSGHLKNRSEEVEPESRGSQDAARVEVENVRAKDSVDKQFQWVRGANRRELFFPR